MENEYGNIDRFDAYLNDTISADEKLVFEKEIQENISFRQEFESYKLLVEGIQESRKQELKDYIKNNTKKEVKSLFRNNGKFYAIAAVIVFFVSVYIVFETNIDNSNEHYAMEKSEDTSVDKKEIPMGNPIAMEENKNIPKNDSEKIAQPEPIENIKEIKIDKLIASNNFPILTYRDYLKDQKPVASKSYSDNNGNAETTVESGNLDKEKTLPNTDKKDVEPVVQPITMKVDFYTSTDYTFHYSMSDNSKIKLYGVDKDAKIVFLHTGKKYAIMINENPYKIEISKGIKALIKINKDIYLK